MKRKLCAAAAAFLVNAVASAAVTTYTDQATFDADAAAIMLTTVDFDNLAVGTDVTGDDLGGVLIVSPSGNSLDVVLGSSTFTPPQMPGGLNSMPATSGTQILSPGGSALVPGPDPRQIDTIELLFSTAVSAVSFDILYQSVDGALFSRATAYDSTGAEVGRITPIGFEPMSAGGSRFAGFLSDNPMTNIARVVIDDFDNNASFPDSNIGLDTLRFTDLGMDNPIPIPAAGLLFLPVLAFLRRRRG
ncbi:hypothetical protein HK107_00910 [Parvularcula sp. ZS-1/3]|uniref:PEP-CTERM sorting domain-containing protein n=1 Tax=Parvularcula mediterranea TaxID=2732508 RepID=A0A7Y3RIZ2_9PROT|nr:hypothetical protein [Parvularcula mediterranea]NNU14881.1 hypothetical protein [Parvularcula mediterranea]